MCNQKTFGARFGVRVPDESPDRPPIWLMAPPNKEIPFRTFHDPTRGNVRYYIPFFEYVLYFEYGFGGGEGMGTYVHIRFLDLQPVLLGVPDSEQPAASQPRNSPEPSLRAHCHCAQLSKRKSALPVSCFFKMEDR